MTATNLVTDHHVSHVRHMYRHAAGSRNHDLADFHFATVIWQAVGRDFFIEFFDILRRNFYIANYFLLLLIEQGVMGLLLFVLLTGYLFYTAQKIYHRTKDLFWKRAAACMAVILAMLCTVNFLSDLIETDKVGSLFYLCLSLLIIADLQTKKVKGF